jgi:D-alanyl-D-alanine carboxypeptidase
MAVMAFTTAAHAQPAAPSAAQLDAVAQKIIAQERVAGASVLVAWHGKIVLHKGYGAADLGLDAASKDETTYHVVGPMLPFTGVAVMQLAERGKLSIDDDLSKYIPEFPLHGRQVKLRQLLNHTSGVVDYHYLGDPIEATSRLPKALDEVMALYADKQWINEPGKKWDWSISGFQLLVTVVERVSGDSFADYVRKNIVEPAGVKATSYCDDRSLVHGLSHPYRHFEHGFVPAYENDMAYNADLRFCSTVGDLYQLWKAIADKPLLAAASFAKMSTAEGAAVHASPRDANAAYGFAMMLNQEDGHRRIGQHGSLFGYSGSLYDFPDDGLTVVVLTNTEGQNAYAITRGLARAALGLPALPAPPPPPDERTLADEAVSAAERAQLAGTFILKLAHVGDGLHDSFTQYRRTFRVFDENGRLMVQSLGGVPERLLKQADGSFAIRSEPVAHLTFTLAHGRATRLTIDPSEFATALAGDRIAPGDPQSFHRAVAK